MYVRRIKRFTALLYTVRKKKRAHINCNDRVDPGSWQIKRAVRNDATLVIVLGAWCTGPGHTP
jgi:hypothetical protein